jgi:Cdc6-like AAA superfamily ATPase
MFRVTMTIMDLELARQKLKMNGIISDLLGREDKVQDIRNFLIERLKVRRTASEKYAGVEAGLVANIDGHCNNTMFVCGVPGTEKTAVVMNVVKRLRKRLKTENCPYQKFDHYYVNAQQVTKPEKIYSEIYYKMFNIDINPNKAQDLLDKIFVPDTANNQHNPEASVLARPSDRNLLSI